jgi:hypothetical protein
VFEHEYRRASTEGATDSRHEVAEDAPLSGTVLLDDDLDGAAGGLRPSTEEIPQ